MAIKLFLLVFLFVTAFFLRAHLQLPQINISKQQTAINIDKSLLKIAHLGNQRLFASILWVQTLLESDIEHYKKKDLNSWMFLRFDALTDLDPYFYHAYRYGGQYLSVIKDDALGAQKIYDKGLILFPDDFWLNFYAAFNYYFELNRPQKAIELYSKIAFSPMTQEYAPYLPSLLAKLKASLGDLPSAFQLLYTAYQQAPDDSVLKKRFHHSLYAIRAELDLQCLNNKQQHCPTHDFNGNPYIKNERNVFEAQENWTPFEIKAKR